MAVESSEALRRSQPTSLFQMCPPKPRRGINAAQVRLTKDLEEVSRITDVTVTTPDPNDIQTIHVRIVPVGGIWKGGKFDFVFSIPDEWPHQRPSVKMITKIWHPNISEDGNVCLNILRDNYTPCMTISALIVGLQFLFTPEGVNPNSPLNTDAALQYIQNFEAFKLKAEEYMEKFCPK